MLPTIPWRSGEESSVKSSGNHKRQLNTHDLGARTEKMQVVAIQEQGGVVFYRIVSLGQEIRMTRLITSVRQLTYHHWRFLVMVSGRLNFSNPSGRVTCLRCFKRRFGLAIVPGVVLAVLAENGNARKSSCQSKPKSGAGARIAKDEAKIVSPPYLRGRNCPNCVH